jgi:serine/threonine protein kinase
MWTLKKLDEISRESRPELDIVVQSELHESAIGSIHYAKLRNMDVSETLKKQNLILKTLDLESQNLWAVVTNCKRAILRGTDKSNVIFLNSNKSEAKLWLETWCKNFLGRESCSLAKIAWLSHELKVERDGATKVLQPNEYLNESMVGLLITKHCDIPHFVKTYGAWIQNSTGFILQEFGGHSMQKHMADMTLKEFKSCLVQVLVALAYAQNKIHLKHHDVHLENVFINRLKDTDLSKDKKLKSSKTWSYTLSKCTVFVDHEDILVKLADYGLASATDPETKIRFERADYELLDSTECEWGQWSGKLQTQKMYDAVVFLSKFFMSEEKGLCRTECSAWAQKVYMEMKLKWPEIECSNIGRPFRDHEGRSSIEELFELDIFKEFKEPKESLVIF